jgi:hypothetical protein
MMRTSNGLRVEAGLIPVLIMRVTKAVTLLHKKNLYGKHSHFAKCLQAERPIIAGSLEYYNFVQEEHHCICEGRRSRLKLDLCLSTLE